MNIFDFRHDLTRDYAEYVRSFVRVGTPDVRAKADEAFANQLLWPEPIVLLNPAFERCANALGPIGTIREGTPSLPSSNSVRAPVGTVQLSDDQAMCAGTAHAIRSAATCQCDAR